MRREAMWAGVVLLLGVGAAVSGCRMERGEQGGGEAVKVATPFGGLQVKTDGAVQAGVGLAVYPGAQLVTKDPKDDSGAADVNLSFGKFQLRVKAFHYRSGDDPDKVEAFYRGELGRYGDVIACQGKRTVGTRVRTAEGLTCGKDETGDEAGGGGDLELKAGSEHHQHVVALHREGAGTKFVLLALDLPMLDGGAEAKE